MEHQLSTQKQKAAIAYQTTAIALKRSPLKGISLYSVCLDATLRNPTACRFSICQSFTQLALHQSGR
ncbi:hypothetical protein IFO70_23850 [Phormidium tenue FACHB-886]|nr:hypothetical protein [Phormidium tenue FACHB-886]